MRWRPEEYLSIVVRKDLRWSQRVAQAVHAMDEWAAVHGAHDGPVLVFGAKDETALLEVAPANAAMFREPDYGGAATAFAAKGRIDSLPLL